MPAKGWRSRVRKCKYCDKLAAINRTAAGRHKGYYRTCGSPECIVRQYSDPAVNVKKTHHGVNHPKYKPIGSRRLYKGHYWAVKISDKGARYDMWRYEHQIVAEQLLGRPLLPNEIVHHIDFDKTNNSPDNLYVYAGEHYHRIGHGTLNQTIKVLIDTGVIIFNGSTYELHNS